MMKKLRKQVQLVSWVLKNRQQIARGLFLIATLLEHIPDGWHLPKVPRGSIFPARKKKP